MQTVKSDKRVLATCLVVLGWSMLSSTTVFAAEVDLQKLQAMVQREADARDIQNLMSRRAHLQAAGDNSWVELFARKQADVSWYMNGSYKIGYDTIKNTFMPSGTERAQRNLESMIKVYPDIENKPENYGVGEFREHALLSPLIIVADDGRTAKGFWHSVGPQLAFRNGEANGTVGYEKYGVDFIKEDGEWRFWHMATYTEIYIELGKTLAEQVPMPGSTQAKEREGATPNPYPAWTPWRVPKQVPLPVPYKTFSETFSYGPSPEQVKAAMADKK